MDKDQVLENQGVVVVKDGRISKMGKAGKVKYGSTL
jgi:imidazolonepropionase-like amidohydrolase